MPERQGCTGVEKIFNCVLMCVGLRSQNRKPFIEGYSKGMLATKIFLVEKEDGWIIARYEISASKAGWTVPSFHGSVMEVLDSEEE